MKIFIRKLCLLHEKLTMWGLKGIWDWFKSFHRTIKLRLFFLGNAKKYPYCYSESGITIVGALSGGQWSLSKVLRDFAYSLRDAGIPFQTYDIGDGSDSREDYADILTPISDFRIRKYSHAVEMISSPLPDGIVDNRARIVFWEFQEGVGEAFHPLLEKDDPIIAMSDFNKAYFEKAFGSRIKVNKILYPLRIDVSQVHEKKWCRKKFGFQDSDFIVFYNFAYTSGWYRKNPCGVLKAFAKAFRNIPNAKIVFKTAARNRFPAREEELLALAKAEGVSDKLFKFDDWMPQSHVYDLTNICDVFLSLHRGEGFGLGIAEAMLLSKPVVATGYSSNTEFCSHHNSIVIPYELIDIKDNEKDAVWYRCVRHWAEPDIDAAAEALRRLYNDETLRFELGRRARDFISQKYSIENFRKSVLEFLKCGQASRVSPSLVK
ncbi:MAG: glycosyltransferase family 4 protein [Kiritimatiellae bacterium]|nr:glycosyltransferase family 4 protein [Kiritimatiellia bacterium]